MPTTNDNWRNDETRDLFEAILRLDSVDEAADFFRDLCTRKELADISHRWTVARLLDTGLPYRQIAEETGASTATISRINQWLLHGTGGYRRALDKVASK